MRVMLRKLRTLVYLRLVKRLTAAQLLVSVRGVLGGYRLARSPNEISVAEIIYALDESHGLTECSVVPHSCALQNVCNTKGHWRLISQVIDTALRKVSLADFLRNRF
jgi:Rrf2 family protein